ncbi:MAG: hypothetical protein SAK29_38690 [Scytonema sp. PMC 1069.18]|nr:hypothetical protein [Scytonema sp. PMC 1069.18]MEC4887404.1 hypothetical protein [Scytonema sp. PMC 1070.18]
MVQETNKNGFNEKNSRPEVQSGQRTDESSPISIRKMSELVGLEEDSVDSDDEESEEVSSFSPQEEAPGSQPSSNRKQKSLSSNPFAKVALVGATTLCGVLVAGVFLSRLMGGTSQKPRQEFPQLSNQEPKDEIEQSRPEEEIELLKTKLALAEQARAVKAAQMQLKTTRPQPRPSNTPTPVERPIARPQPETRVVVQKVPTPGPTVYRVVERVVRAPQVAQAQPAPPPPTPSPQPKLTPTPSPTPTPTPTPTFEMSLPELLTPLQTAPVAEALSEIRKMVPPPASPPVATRRTPTPVQSLSPEEEIVRIRENLERRNARTARNTASDSKREASLASQSTKAIAIGTSAKAELATAFFGEASRGSTTNTKSDYTFVVRLKEALKSTDDKIAIPRDTELVTELDRLTDNGMVQLNVIAMVSKEKNGTLKEVKLPPGAMKIRAPQGRPLLASKYPKSSGTIASMDTALFALGGLGQIGDILNRPEQRTEPVCTITRGVDRDGNETDDNNRTEVCTTVTRTDQQRNIGAAILEGGMKSLVPQITLRNQQAVNEMITKGNIWYLPVGTEVEVFANRLMKVSS